jgi:hypothetical protein
MRGVLDTTLCEKVCQSLAAGRWISPVSTTNKTDRHDMTEILFSEVKHHNPFTNIYYMFLNLSLMFVISCVYIDSSSVARGLPYFSTLES